MGIVSEPKAVAATSFRDATAADWDYVTRLGREAMERDAGRAVMALLRSQKDVPRHGWQVNNYEHSLQCATRALRNGESEEYVVCCLLHDVTQDLNPYNHDKSAGDLLRYHVSDENHWVIANHQIFQLPPSATIRASTARPASASAATRISRRRCASASTTT